MVEAAFVASFFLPILWRYLLAIFGLSPTRKTWHGALFLTPLFAVAVYLCNNAIREGVYGVFVPLMLVVFWLPQLIWIGFFFWCDLETIARDNLENR